MRKLTTLPLGWIPRIGRVGGRARAAGDEGNTDSETATDTGSGADSQAETAHAQKVVPMADLLEAGEEHPSSRSERRKGRGGAEGDAQGRLRRSTRPRSSRRGKGTEVEVNADGMGGSIGRRPQDLPKTQQPKTQQNGALEEKGTTEVTIPRSRGVDPGPSVEGALRAWGAVAGGCRREGGIMRTPKNEVRWKGEAVEERPGDESERAADRAAGRVPALAASGVGVESIDRQPVESVPRAPSGETPAQKIAEAAEAHRERARTNERPARGRV